MVVIEGLKDGPVEGEDCILVLRGDGKVDEQWRAGLFVEVGTWHVSEEKDSDREIEGNFPLITADWQTGEPTEEGVYLVKYRTDFVELIHYIDGKWLKYLGDYSDVTDCVFAWHKIAPYEKEVSNG